ncbi:hypothetical protein BGZ83_001750 [Gryganskiella cystojenkinii]|nr:hypothetical protein BGZ83_001750 [Gryganskiella cystojenkinii]
MPSIILLAIRILLTLFCLVVMSIDIYLIKTYTEHETVAFLWKFYVQFGLEGLLTLTFFICTIIVHFQIRRHRQYAHYNESAPEYPKVVSGSGFRFRLSGGQLLAVFTRAVFVGGVALGLLFVSVKDMMDSSRRTVFLPFLRSSAQADAYDNDFSKFDAHNIFHCPKDDSSISVPASLTSASSESALAAAAGVSSYLICNLDRSSVIVAAVVGGLALMEVVLTILWDNRRQTDLQHHHQILPRTSGSSSTLAMFMPWKKPSSSSKVEFDHTQHIELGASHQTVQPHKP